MTKFNGGKKIGTVSLLCVAMARAMAIALLLGLALLAAHPYRARGETALRGSDSGQDSAQPSSDLLRDLYDFPLGKGGYVADPNGDLIFDAAGNLYGTTYFGGMGCGMPGCGTVFQLSRNADGTWKHITLFKFNGKDGANPHAGLSFDRAGNLYGTTSDRDLENGSGTVFRLSPRKNGTWTLTALFVFNGKNGNDPEARLVLDAAGNVYGTTSGGGLFTSACSVTGCGTGFQLSPGQSDGTWKHTALFAFDGKNGDEPLAGVIFDAAGNLYGTTAGGGTGCPNGCGTVFRLSPAANGTWKHTTLVAFDGKNGDLPAAGLIFDSAGSLYGTTIAGGTDCFGSEGCGNVFRLSPRANGIWKVTTLLLFDVRNGSQPQSDLIFDSVGDLYGTAADGHVGLGVVFELSPRSKGTWKDTTLATFNGKNGTEPFGGLVLDGTGNLYGATTQGGRDEGGVVFEVSPKEASRNLESEP